VASNNAARSLERADVAELGFEKALRMQAIETAPKDREIFLSANFAPLDETRFIARGRYLVERTAFAVEDRPARGLPSLGWMTVNAIGWLDI